MRPEGLHDNDGTAGSSPRATSTVAAYVEVGVGMAYDDGVAAWAFDLDLWGTCGQGPDEAAALTSLAARLGPDVELVVAERITGDEQAFARDHRPCTADERAATLAVLGRVRPETIALVRSLPRKALDWDDPDRVLPDFARWRTLRQTAWHVADTESRYYLPRTGLAARPRIHDLVVELDASAAHARDAVARMPADLVRTSDGETWTSTKLLRRLAWHERGELEVMRELAARAAGS